MNHAAIIVQARMSSNRLPGKVLMPVNGKPLLAFLLERLTMGLPDIPLVLATSTERSDDAIEQFCCDVGVPCHRGALRDVASRFRTIAKTKHLSLFVRVNGDSPFLDPALVQVALQVFADKKPDLATNTQTRSFPVGQSVEVLNARTYVAAYEQFFSSDHSEHVTRYYYEHAEAFRIANFVNEEDCSGESLAVDTAEDFGMCEQIVARMNRPHWEYGWHELLEIKREVVAS